MILIILCFLSSSPILLVVFFFYVYHKHYKERPHKFDFENIEIKKIYKRDYLIYQVTDIHQKIKHLHKIRIIIV